VSNSSSSSSSSGGIGCLGLLAVLLTVLFVGLKLTGHIAWSWFWVISPLLIYAGLGVAVVVIILGIFILGALGIGFAKGVSGAIKSRKRDKELEARQRVAQAISLGTFDSSGKQVKEPRPYKTHQWML